MAYCELCNKTVVRGIVHRINWYTVCHDCRNDLVASYGEEVDNTAAAQHGVQPNDAAHAQQTGVNAEDNMKYLVKSFAAMVVGVSGIALMVVSLPGPLSATGGINQPAVVTGLLMFALGCALGQNSLKDDQVAGPVTQKWHARAERSAGLNWVLLIIIAGMMAFVFAR